MREVQPIRNPKIIKNMRLILRDQSIRNELLFVLGVNTGLRISDILKCQVKDVLKSNGKIVDYVIVREEKTNKWKKYFISDAVRKMLEKYFHEYGPLQEEQYLFKSKKRNAPINRVQAWRIINFAAEQVGLVERDDQGKIRSGEFGTHSLRKTFGYHAYQAGYSVELLMDIFNHSSQAQTLKYIGIREEDKKEVYMNLNLGE